MAKGHRSNRASARRVANIKARASARSLNALSICSVIDCERRTQASSGKGLSRRYCGRHVKYYARHGSAHRGSYRAQELKPYLLSAERWLKAHAKETFVKLALIALLRVLEEAGRPEIITRMHGAPAKKRARAALARLRTQSVKPERLLTIALATWALVDDDWSFRADNEFRRVQIAKQAHRLAARHTPTWAEGLPRTSPSMKAMNRFPEATGPVLRELGRMIDHVGGSVAESALPELLAIKRQHWGKHPSQPTSLSLSPNEPVQGGGGSRNMDSAK